MSELGDFDAEVVAFNVALNDLFRAYGSFVALFADVEEMLEDVISAYFRIGATERENFHRWVVGPLGAADKIEVVRRIVADVADASFADVPDRLVELNSLRNRVVHSTLLQGERGWNVDGWRRVSVTRRGSREEPVDVEALDTMCDYIMETLFFLLHDLAVASRSRQAS